MSVNVYVNTGLQVKVTPQVSPAYIIGNLPVITSGSQGASQSLVDAGYYPRSNPSGYATGIDSSQFIKTGQSGLFYPATNPSGFTTTGWVDSNYVANYESGQFVTTGQTGVFLTSAALTTGQFITTAQTGQFAPSGMTGQFVTTAMTGKLGTYIFSGSGTLVQTPTGQTLSGLFVLSGQNITVNTLGSTIVLSGSGQFPAVTLLKQTGFYNQSNSPLNVDVYAAPVAGRSVIATSTSFGNYFLQAAFWSKQIAMSVPGSFQNMTTFGHATPVNLGTVTTSGSLYYGYGTNFQTAVAQGSSAGHSFSGTSYFVGTGDLRSGTNNGFFFICQFSLPDTTGGYVTGAQGGPNGQPTGFRVFCGVTDQSLATVLGLNIPTGCCIGLSCVRATGTMDGQSNRNDNNWQIATCDNNLQVLTDTSIPFNSGIYQVSIYVPPSPNVNAAYWQLDDQSRIMSASGFVTARLPIPGTPLRPAIGLFSASGVKNMMVHNVYIST